MIGAEMAVAAAAFCLFVSFLFGRHHLIVSPRYRRYRRWRRSGEPGVVSMEDAKAFRAWKELGRPVTGSGVGLYRAIVADRNKMKARIRELEIEDSRSRSALDRYLLL